MLDLSSVNSLLITGSNGFVGRSIVDQIANNDSHQLPNELFLVTRHGIDFDLPPNIAPITKVISHDLTKEWTFNLEVSHIINLAADGSPSSYSTTANEIFTSIVGNLISWTTTLHSAPRIFHASSGVCSGFKPLDNQNFSSNVKSIFAENRLRAESALKKASEDVGFELSIGRLFTFSGNHLLRKSQYAISQFIKSAVSNKTIKVLGDPNTVRSYLHQEEMAKWILSSLVYKEKFSTFEIGSSEAVTIRELAEFTAQETSASLSFASEFEPGDLYLPNNQETMDKLRVAEGKSWKLAVVEMIRELRENSYGTF